MPRLDSTDAHADLDLRKGHCRALCIIWTIFYRSKLAAVNVECQAKSFHVSGIFSALRVQSYIHF